MSVRRLDTLNGEAKPHCLENGRKATELRIAVCRQSAVKLCAVQVRTLGNPGHAAERLRHLPKRDQKLALVVVLEDAVQQLHCIGRVVAEDLGHHVVM